MNSQRERRHFPRITLDPPEVGLLLFQTNETDSGNYEALYVDLLNRSQNGVNLKTKWELKPSTALYMQIYDLWVKEWLLFEGKIRWMDQDTIDPSFYLYGIELRLPDAGNQLLWEQIIEQKKMPLPQDYQFFRRTKLLRYICRDAVCPLLNNIIRKDVRAGERFIHQGEKGDTLYVIQRGSCVIIVEKAGQLIPITRCKEGDVLGEMALLTGEPRSAHVDAETEMRLWALTRNQFEQISDEFPDFRNFLTDIVSKRFSSRKETAERKIGKYIITDIIGRGGYSVVYKGIHSELNMPVCIKMLKHDLAMDPDFQKNFKNEAKIIAKFNHRNIIRVYDIEERYRTIFIIMELLEGVSLAHYIDHNPRMSVDHILRVLMQVCAGLEYSHKNGIVHQDIKPANIFLLPQNHVKILDFGIAAPRGSEIFDFAGTIFYMAPEQILSDPIDERTDIYALGITAYEMVSGRRPYPEDNLGALMQLHLNEDIPDPAIAVPSIPEELRTFIITCCQRDPDKRYSNILEAVQELKPLIKKLGLEDKGIFKEKKKMTTLHLIYRDSEQVALNQLLEEFISNVKKLGVTLKAADFKDI